MIEPLVLAAIGVTAGALGTVSGVASVVSFPALLLLGYTPLQANVINTVGGAFIGVGSTWGFRDEIGQRSHTAVRLSLISAGGGGVGALLLLWLGNDVFAALVPALLLFATALVLVQPRLVRWLTTRDRSGRRGQLALIATGIAGIYGGYFGAGLGICLVAIFGTLLAMDMRDAIAVKAVVALCANLVAVTVFVVRTTVPVEPVLVLSASSIVGGLLGARLTRVLPDRVLRAVAVSMGLVAAGYALLR